MLNENNREVDNHQLMRFCLYGFLKNQVYFESFLILAFLEKGLSFLQIGILVSFRAVSVNIMEIPSGALADVWGRRRSMIFSMLCYIASFIVFALSEKYWVFFVAMMFFSIGEAFRTGTHKAMIFDWLHHLGREDEKTKIYGFTRSWSKIGSAFSVLIAVFIVISTEKYIWIFWLSTIPYFLNILNFMFYPDFLDTSFSAKKDMSQVFFMLRNGITLCFKKEQVRSLISENICFEGFYSSAKEYLQPLLQATALTLPVMLSYSDKNRTALLVGITYAILNIFGSVFARKSHRIANLAGNELKLSGWILFFSLLCYFFAGVGILWNLILFPIISFVMLSLLLNIWKPIFVSRFYDLADKETAATTLSIANQSKSLSVAVIAPLLGWGVDVLFVSDNILQALFPVFFVGVILGIIGILVHVKSGNSIAKPNSI